MRPGGGREKGFNFERMQAKTISNWVSSGKDKDLLWRSTASGARSTSGSILGAQYGDLALNKHSGTCLPLASLFLDTFCVELKCYKEFNILSEWKNTKSNLHAWWRQVTEAATNNKVEPLLIVKPDRRPILLIFSYEVHTSLSRYLLKSKLSLPYIEIVNDKLKLAMYEQDPVFTLIPFTRLIEVVRAK